MRNANILVVEDDPSILRVYCRLIRQARWNPIVAGDLRAARQALRRHPVVHLVVLDRVFTGGGDGLSLCLELKKDPIKRFIPIIMISGLGEAENRLKGYRFGADLYLAKPVTNREFLASVKTLLTRLPYRQEVEGRISHGDIQIDLAARTIRIGRQAYYDLPPLQFDLLALLVGRRGRVVARERIVRSLWDKPVRDKEVDVLVSRLRRRLGGQAARCIVPVRSQGYCVRASPE